MKEIVKLVTSSYVDKFVLTQNALLSDYVDWNSRQSFDDFCNKSNIHFMSDDFCIMADDEVLNRLKNLGKIDLSDCERVGWFDKNVNTVKWRTFIQYSPEAYNRISVNVLQSSFSQLKKNIRSLEELNRLKGGLLLSWYFNKEDYEKFFSKIEVKKKSRWVIDLSELNNKDLQILSQLTLISHKGQKSSNSDMTNLILKTISSETKSKEDAIKHNFSLFQKLLQISLDYLVGEVSQLEKQDYINFLISKKLIFNDELFVEELFGLRKKYVDQVRFENIRHPVIKRLASVLSVIDSDTSELKEDLANFSKGELFIIGMIKGFNSIESSGFSSNNIIYFFLDVISDHLLDIKPRSSEDREVVHINFESSAVDRDAGNKFSFLEESILIFRTKEHLYNQLNQIKVQEESLKIKKDEWKRSILAIKRENMRLEHGLKNAIEIGDKLRIEKKNYEDNKKLNSFNSIVWKFKTDQDREYLSTSVKKLDKESFNDFVKAYKKDSTLNGERGTHLDRFELNKDNSVKMSLINKNKVINTILSFYDKERMTNSNHEIFLDEKESKMLKSHGRSIKESINSNNEVNIHEEEIVDCGTPVIRKLENT
jgi:hypothetical protein